MDKGTALFGSIKKKDKDGQISEMKRVEVQTQQTNKNYYDYDNDPFIKG